MMSRSPESGTGQNAIELIVTQLCGGLIVPDKSQTNTAKSRVLGKGRLNLTECRS